MCGTRAWNALRQLIDEVDGGGSPGLYLLAAGMPAAVHDVLHTPIVEEVGANDADHHRNVMATKQKLGESSTTVTPSGALRGAG